MDPTTLKEVGSFAGVIVPVMIAFVWGGKLLLNWFTRTLDKKDEMLAKQQEQVDRLVTELVAVMRETQAAHTEMVRALNEARMASSKEHDAIMACVERMKAA